MEDNFEIQRLIETKNFNELSNIERTIVEKEISQIEFDKRRKLLLSTQLFLKDELRGLNPRTDYKNSIKAIMASKNFAQNLTPLQKMFKFRIPIYIPVTAIILLLFVLPFFYNQAESKIYYSKQGHSTVPKTIVKTDTLIIEKSVPTYVNVPLIKYVEVIKEKEIDFSSEASLLNTFEGVNIQQANNTINVNDAKEQFESQLKNIGKSSGEQEELNKFLVIAK